jgi:hypothetical protein
MTASVAIIHPTRFFLSDRRGLQSLTGGLIPDGSRKFCFPEIPDVIKLTEPNAGQLLTNRLLPSLFAILPVVDASCGQATNDLDRRRADLCAAGPSKRAIADALKLLKRAIEGCGRLRPAVLQSADPRIQLTPAERCVTPTRTRLGA